MSSNELAGQSCTESPGLQETVSRSTMDARSTSRPRVVLDSASTYRASSMLIVLRREQHFGSKAHHGCRRSLDARWAGA